MSRNLSHLSARHDPGALHQAVHALDTRNPEAIRLAHGRFHVGAASLVGAASFYDFLQPEHQRKRVYVCDGTSCELAGTQPGLRARLHRHFPDSDIGTMRCLGQCHNNHALHLDGRNYSVATDEELSAIIADNHGKSSRSFAVESNLREPILTAPPKGLDETYSVLERVLREPPERLIDKITRSRLSGRGGAHYPAGRKWAACRAAAGSPKYVVCNADEGDPGAFADRFLLEERPHLVLLGMLLAGFAVGATTGILYVRGEYPEAVAAVEAALAQLHGTRWLGDNICGSGFPFRFHVLRGAGAYIVGEETALLAAIEGQRPEVRVRPPYPTEEGLFRKPTVVNNVMTLALVPWIVEHGGEAFARLGTATSSGPLLATLDGRFQRPGLYELEMGTPLHELVHTFGGGFAEPLKAIQAGGPLGGVVPISRIDSLTLDHESFEEAGFSLGHGSFVGIPERVPMIEFMTHLFEFTAGESCGKCFPCRLGSQRGAEMLRRAVNRRGTVDNATLSDLLDALKETSLCGLGGGLPLPIGNILEHFADELRPHFSGSGTP